MPHALPPNLHIHVVIFLCDTCRAITFSRHCGEIKASNGSGDIFINELLNVVFAVYRPLLLPHHLRHPQEDECLGVADAERCCSSDTDTGTGRTRVPTGLYQTDLPKSLSWTSLQISRCDLNSELTGEMDLDRYLDI